ncbi:hypothetical protein CMI37_09650 [Candidatus Pacearchaeota archaeon]|nr:hypothetical protein [Candidatus Pacearchaeota archaeon]|tara:strand:+ start:3968 stop:4663 length:696 start_codon:yes stop_codon:yes gene_type:complete
MKSFIFCTCYIGSEEARLKRYEKWINYYKGIPFSDDKPLFVIDDGSDEEYLRELADVRIDEGNLEHAPDSKQSTLYHFKERVGINPEDNVPGLFGSTLGWYRSFFYSLEIASKFGYDKIIHLESDAYLITQKVCDYIDSLKTGWTSLYCPRYTFPETSIQIICEDQFDVFRKMVDKPLESYRTSQAENIIPFTHVEDSFIGDRYGEMTSMQLPGIDYYNQCNFRTNLKFKN